MRALFLLLGTTPFVSAWLITPEITQATTKISHLATQALDQAHLEINGTTQRGNCSMGNIRVRREWGSLSGEERKSYIRAVQCLQAKPARTPTEQAPGAKTRFDDYVAAHINQTMTIHYTGNFLSWHRYYTWTYEEALRNECGYEGTQPYWDWAKTSVTGLTNSSIFDGSDTSMSGDGVYAGSREDLILGDASIGQEVFHVPAGNGGGCVRSGPFRNMTVNLGPIGLILPGGDTVTNPGDRFAHNPRCLKRDLTNEINRRFTNASSILDTLLKHTIDDFQMLLQGAPGTGTIGIHGGGHYSIGGDPGRDVFTSPGDPVFWLHHSMIDRVWWIWQMMSPSDRVFSDKAVAGTNTFLNKPPSANTTLDDYVDLGYSGGFPMKIGDLLSTTSGPFCYVYE